MIDYARLPNFFLVQIFECILKLNYMVIKNFISIFIYYFNRLSSFLAAKNVFLHIGIGAFAWAVLAGLSVIGSDEDMRVLIGLLSLPIVIIFPLPMYCSKFFYGEEQHKILCGPVRGQGLGYPFKDAYFYQTITSDISVRRKFAGYVYVLSLIHI